MICPKCGTETIRILEDDYCPRCSNRIHREEKKDRSSVLSFGISNSYKAIILGFLTTFSLILFLFFLTFLIIDGFTDFARDIFLIFVGFISASFGGAVVYKADEKNYLKNIFILSGILVLMNAFFNFMHGFNFISVILSILCGALFYPLPFFLGAFIYKRRREML